MIIQVTEVQIHTALLPGRPPPSHIGYPSTEIGVCRVQLRE